MPDPALPAPSPVHGTRALAASALVVLIAALAAAGLQHMTTPGSVALIFLVAVLFSAVLFGLRTGLAASGMAFLAYNFFFVDPVLTLRVTRVEDLLALAVFVLVAGLTGTLAGRLREQANAAEERARLLEHLSLLSGALGTTASETEARQALLFALRALTGRTAQIIDHRLAADPPLGTDDLQAADRALRHGTPQPATASGWSDGRFSFLPLVIDPEEPLVVGVPAMPLSPDLEKAVMSAIRQTGAAIIRLRMGQLAGAARMRAERETLRSALLSSLSHDLKTPLATILGSVTTLRELAPALPEAARHDLLAAIEEDARRLNTYVGDLLHMTRLQAGLDLRLDWIDPRDIVDAAVKRIRRSHPGQRIVMSIDPALPLLRTDPSLLEQALFNCIDNATSIAPAHSTITVGLTQADQGLSFFVEDEGPGVAAKDHQRIFELFQRGETRAANGTGLGLAITKGIVQALDGTLGLDSPLTAKGGARFWLAFPVGKEDCA